jgi:hypothetical protein
MATRRNDYPNEPMDLTNMRENGVRSLEIMCPSAADVRPNWRERSR